MYHSDDIRTAYSECQQELAQTFNRLFNEFRNETDKLERQGDENVFQLLRSKYSSVLKQRLERSALLLIEKCTTAEMQGRLRISFTELITYYLKEFTRKSGSI